MSYRRLCLLLLAALLPLLAFQAVIVHTLRDKRETEVGRDVQRLLDHLDAEQRRVVAGIEQTLAAAAEIDYNRFAGPACRDTLARLKERLHDRIEISLADLHGSLVCPAQPGQEGHSITERPHFARTLSQGFAVGEFGAALSDGRSVLPFGMAHRAADGSVDGVVSALLDLRWLNDFFASKPLPEGAAMMIADAAGTVLFRYPALPGVVDRSLPEPYRSDQSEAQGRLMRITSFDGVERIVASAPLGASPTGLTMTYGVPRAAALGATDAAILRSLGAFAAILALCGSGAAWGLRQHLRVRDAMLAATRASAADLARERTLLQAVLEHLPCGLLVTAAPDGDLVLSSAASRAILGINPAAPGAGDDIRARAYRPDGAPIVGDEHPIALALTRGERIEQREIRYRRADGRDLLLVANAAPIRDTDGRITHAIATFIDATEHKSMVDEMQRKEAHLAMALSTAEAYAWSHDMATGRTTWSEGAATALGFPASGRGIEWLDAVHPEDRASVRAGMARAIAGQQPEFRGEVRVIGSGRGPRWISLRGRALCDDGAGGAGGEGCAGQLIGLAVDITERKTIEGALCAAKEDADRASLAKSKFLAAASHDLRQPIQSLFLFAGGLRRHVDDVGRARLAHLERSLDTLKAMLDSLLDVSRYDSGVIEAVVSEFPIRAVIDDLATCYAPIAAAKGIAWANETPTTIVRSDPNLLGRMVRNLIENAIRYTERGSIRVACREESGLLRIEIHDTGIGIPPDHLHRIWDEFHQVGNPARDREKGLGLGLAIVKRLSSLLGATVEVRSRPGNGSCFSFGIPIVTAAAEAGETAGATAPEAEGGDRVAIVVDDDATVLMSLQTLLMDWGFRVIVAADPDAALARAKDSSTTPSIIIADYNLRDGHTGVEAIWRIREICGEGIPGILLTGDTGLECRREAAAHGLHVMQKPVTPRELSAILAARALAAA